MNGDMAASQFDPQARYAALDERVTNLRTSLVAVEGEMRSGFSSLSNQLSSITTEMRASQKTAWPVIWSAIGVSFAILLAIGSQALSPLRDAIVEIKAQVEERITREEINQRAARATEDRARTEGAITDLRSLTVTRAEWMERNSSRDHQIDDLQREIGELKTAQTSTYNARDLLLDLRERLDRLEHDRAPGTLIR